MRDYYCENVGRVAIKPRRNEILDTISRKAIIFWVQ